MEKCVFCQIINKEIKTDIVDENEHAIAILDISPASNGHILIIPKKHYRNFALTDSTYVDGMMRLAKNITFALEETFKEIEGFNYLMNSNKVAGQVIMHTHLHIIPKYNENEGFVFSANKNSEELKEVKDIYKKLTTKLKQLKKSFLSKHYMV